MYVCLCNGVTDREIKRAINKGASNLEHLREELGVASRCGRCACLTQSIIDETLGELAVDAMALPYAAA
jgi:bacterioferritin-associated ferredoxin